MTDCYCELRKQYKHLLLTKEKEYKPKCRKGLQNNIGDPKQFWRNIKKFATKTRQVSDISDEQRLEHFEKVLNVEGLEQDTDDEMSSSYTTESKRYSYAEDDSLNSDISPQEVTESIDHLKANKAAGLDGIIPEVFKHSCDKIIPFLVHLFNTAFASGEYPETWTEAVIYPLHKKGSIHEPDNYRGISLLTRAANFKVTLLTNDYQDGLKTMTYLETSKQIFARTTLPLIISLHYFL